MKKKMCAILAAGLLAVALGGCSTGLKMVQKSEGSGSDQPDKTSQAVQQTAETTGSEAGGSSTGGQAAGIPGGGVVLLDESGVKVTATGISDGFLGPEIALDFENNTDLSLTFSTKRASVNGYMMNLLMIAEVAAGKKASETIDLLDSELEICGIDTVAEIELEFNIYNSDTYDDYLNSDVIKLKLADGHQQAYDDSGTVLIETNGVKVVSKGMSDEALLLGYEWLLYIENQSDETIYINLDDVSVNDSMMEVYYGQEITSGKRSLRPVYFSSSDLEKNGIEKIEKVEFVIKGDNLETWEAVFETDPIVVEFK